MKKRSRIWIYPLIAMGLLLTLNNSCKKDNPIVLVIGQSYHGGIIGYILQSGDPGYDANVQHGLIAAPVDQSTGIEWYNGASFATGATSTGLGSGDYNTSTIVNSQSGGSYAAELCYDLVLGGYSDWFLPDKDELNKLYINSVAISGFASGFYWSSSEYGSENAWVQSFDDGSQGDVDKSYPLYVRAVRTF